MSLQTNRADREAEAESLMLARLWQWPLVLWAGSLGACTELMWPRPAPLAPHPHPSEHDQLIVPEPIEETGEHSLFA